MDSRRVGKRVLAKKIDRGNARMTPDKHLTYLVYSASNEPPNLIRNVYIHRVIRCVFIVD